MQRLRMIMCGLALVLLLLPAHLAAAAGEYSLNFTTAYFDRHSTVTNVFKPWIKQLSDKTGGKLEITYFPPNTICPEPEILDSVAAGAVDMGGNTFTRNTGRMILAEMGQMPMLSKSPRVASMAMYDAVHKYPQYFPEFQKDIKVMFIWSSALVQVHTTKKPIRKLEDFKGMKLIAWTTGSLDMAKLLGAIPMMQSNADTYLALERGMADGLITAIAPLRSQKLTDILRYHTICDLSLSPFWAGINRKTYEALPAPLRKSLDDSTGLAFSGIVGQSLEDGAKADLEWIKQQGKAEIITLSDAERERWKKQLEKPMLEISLKKMVEGGIEEKAALEFYNYYKERIAYYSRK